MARPVGDEAGEVLDQGLAPLVRIDASEIQHERIANADAVGRRRRAHRHRLEPHPMMHDGASGPGTRRATSACSSGVRKTKAARQLEILRQQIEFDDRILFRGGHQNRAIGDERQAEERHGVAERPEQHAVVAGALWRRDARAARVRRARSRGTTRSCSSVWRRSDGPGGARREAVQRTRPRHRKAQTRTPFTMVSPGGYTLRQVT